MTPPRAQPSRSLLLPGLVLVPLLAFWVVVFFQVRAEEQIVRQRTLAHSQSVARGVADHVSHVVRQAEHWTQLFKLSYEANGGRLAIGLHQRHSALIDSVMLARLDLPAARVDRTGRVVDSGNGFSLVRLPARTMRALQAWPAGGAVLSAVRLSGSGQGNRWKLQVAQALADRNGRFDGAIVLMVDPVYFIDEYERHNLGPGDLLSIASHETKLVAGRTGTRHFNLYAAALAGEKAAQGAGALEVGHPVDGTARIYAYQQVPRAPLVVVAGLDEAVALAEFRRHRLVYVVFTALASVLIGTAFIALMRQGRRLSTAVEQAHSAEERLRAAIDGSSDSFFVLKAMRDRNGQVEDFEIVDLNERGAAMAGRARGELLGQPAFRSLPQFRQSGLFERYCEVVERGELVNEEIEVPVEGEPTRWVFQQVIPIAGGVAISARDVSARKRAELEIRDHRSFLMSLVEHVPLLVAVKTAHRGEAARMVVWNRAAAAITGYASGEVVGRAMADAFPPDFSLSAADGPVSGVAERDQVVHLVRKDGALRYLHTITVPLYDDEGAPEYVMCIAEDITVRRQQEMQLRLNAVSLRESEARLRTVADSIPAMIAYVDSSEVYRFLNRTYLPEFDLGQDVIGMTMCEANGEERYARVRDYVRRVLAGERLSFEDQDVRDGVERTMQVSYLPQLSDDGKSVRGFHIMRQDVTHQKREKKQLLRLAQHDPLTGLANRAGFNVKLAEAMAHSAATGSPMAVMFLDLDRFKPVNDTHGHAVGDALLKAIAQRMTQSLRAADTVARMGGDEFTVIVENVHRAEDASLAASKLVAALRPEFDLDGIRVSISASVGIALYRGDDTSAGDLLQRADDMLYEAKEAGRDTFRMAA